MRAIKIALVSLALLLSAGSIFVWSKWQPCSTARECYWSWKTVTSNTDPMERRRFISIYDGFTASTELAAFQVPTSLTANGILLIHRAGRKAAIIAREGYTHWSPRFSTDGERLIFARAQAGRAEQELVSCSVSEWRCTLLLRTSGSILSPVEFGRGKVIFALGYPLVRDGKTTQHRRYDFYVVVAGQPPVRMTQFEFLSLHAISVGQNKIYFQAIGGKSESKADSCADASKCDSSQIFSLNLDLETGRILNPPERLKPAVMIDGISVKPAISGDATRLAFLNTGREKFTYRYNLKVGDGNGDTLKTVAVDGVAFSTAAFVGDTLLVNELFNDHYRIGIFDCDLNRIDSIDVVNSPDFLGGLSRIPLTIETAAGVF
jgi:hypothetical protein